MLHFHALYVPGTQMTSVFEGQPPKTRPFPIKTMVIWVPGIKIRLKSMRLAIILPSPSSSAKQGTQGPSLT